ncbi:hypothetical protein [Butyrivibrio sp. M55]|jgi:hypothetical protein|uniref:hypothetical protein n=1 Tax=Butyrivibrio sp. M55 TaxID=1855323 RepID=UPI0008E663C4|nr:hypothetical protein [Butyrivibrio sp. M55]SFU51918.1 hypothetical protein SAMN05216540_103104 [Butyrivibrio sp. M55]
MKKRVLALCLAISLSTVCIACESSSAPETTETAESSENVTPDDTNKDIAPISDEAPMGATENVNNDIIDEGTDDSSGSKATDFDCSVFTGASYSEVCEYAKKVKDLTIAEDWNALGDMILYPVEDLDGKVLKSKDEFVKYASDPGFDKSYIDSISKWSVDEIWFNSHGACIDDGLIWFQDCDPDGTEFMIRSFFDLTPH